MLIAASIDRRRAEWRGSTGTLPVLLRRRSVATPPPQPHGAHPQGTPHEPEDVTRLLQASCDGDASARDALLSAVHGELLGMARAQMRSERRDHTLGATALVHEAYLRLFRSLATETPAMSGPTAPSRSNDAPDWTNRATFYAAAATAMRRILVDHARSRAREKRGGSPSDALRVSLDVIEAARDTPPHAILALDEAIERLAAIDPRAAEVVRLRFFAGLEQSEIGEVMGCTERTIKRDWAFARAWLHDALAPERTGGDR